jgi:hypothetical protein
LIAAIAVPLGIAIGAGAFFAARKFKKAREPLQSEKVPTEEEEEMAGQGDDWLG